MNMPSATLHIISSRTSAGATRWCLENVGDLDAILITDTNDIANIAEVTLRALASTDNVCWLAETGAMPESPPPAAVRVIDYPGWVRLCCEFETVISW
ncbi:hypothetical protein [Pseudomaricurvus sp. HS19]|uniref:hypothetical protein n=1 Tax=Pseudomaricurvus sp. HS19 TaxID=2692626 RepID=UPI0013713204|nr:hypothetical protein [Pseudomaricurvus sp. HS19]MYM62203.1 hypothetical protein [Pseudomaricurvus sp. HS19]